ncbi:MAG TPA: lysozyme inhibitor LprI family protein [Pyrinomonadaceae bacterium]|jgi:uncharacterized protein YecT (DUF1311 family)|nr:lysozyme inhibitor LprI family protein [Pyrinomonadaceae bacterium]
MKRILLTLLLSCAALSAEVPAQKPEANDPCRDPQSQAEMNMCAAKRFKAADAELNRVYNRLVSKLGDDAGSLARLKTAETSWLKYRDDNCDYEADFFEGGSMKPLIYSSCMERMTKARTAELRGQIKEFDQ